MILPEILILLLLILLNGFFAMSEIAIISARKPVLQEKAKRGNAGARVALDLSKSPNRFLSSIQVGITTVGVLMGAFGGATIADYLASFLQNFPSVQPYAQPVSIAVVVIFISYFTLILGELAPKRLALSNAEEISSLVSRPMHVISIIATPIIKILSLSTDTALFFLRARTTTIPSITEEEISHAIDMGRKAGLVEPDEQLMVKRVFEFGDRQAHSIMTPRTDCIWLDLAEPIEENIGIILQHHYSRFPVIREDPDIIIGVLNARDLLQKPPQERELGSFVQVPLFVPEHMSVLKVLELFRRHPVHFAIVIDEYGGFRGIITPYDLLQAIVGELPAEREERMPAITKDINGYWNVDGSLPIQEFKVFFNITEMPEEQRYGTLSGFTMLMLGHIPLPGELFTWNGYEFQVTEMTDHRVSKLRVHGPIQENS